MSKKIPLLFFQATEESQDESLMEMRNLRGGDLNVSKEKKSVFIKNLPKHIIFYQEPKIVFIVVQII